MQPHLLSNSIQPSPSPERTIRPQASKYYSGDALKLFETRTNAMSAAGKSPAKDERMRLSSKVSMILQSVEEAKLADKARDKSRLRPPPTPLFRDTALGKIKVASTKCGTYLLSPRFVLSEFHTYFLIS